MLQIYYSHTTKPFNGSNNSIRLWYFVVRRRVNPYSPALPLYALFYFFLFYILYALFFFHFHHLLAVPSDRIPARQGRTLSPSSRSGGLGPVMRFLVKMRGD